MNTNCKNIIVTVIYRQPTGNIKVFEESLEKMLCPKKDKNKKIYITGDMNLNLLDYKDSAKVKSYLNLMFSHSFVPLINKPTRISKNNATVIDHILTNSYITENYSTGIVKADLSDHFPVFFITKSKLSRIRKEDFIIKREITDENLKNFNDVLLGVDWSKVFQSSDPNKAYAQ